jgi:hypothetical protein
MTPAERDRSRRVAERVVAEHAARTIGKTCDHAHCEYAPRDAVAHVDGVDYCGPHAPLESDYGLASVVLRLLPKEPI